MLESGLSHTSELTVSPEHTARFMGSGDLEVLSTPSMTALMENAAMLAVAPRLPEGSTTVGGHIESSHLRPTRLGRKVTATATLRSVEGRKLLFDVEAYEGEHLIGRGTHLRFVVDRQQFMDKL